MYVYYTSLILSCTLFLICSIAALTRAHGAGYSDTEILDANQHVIMFENGVDAYMAGEYDKCDDYWLPLARAGDPMAARNVALLYHHGKGVRKDIEEAEIFYRLAADNGVKDAQTILGTMLLKGDELKRNIPDAVKYLTAAQQAGDPISAWNLGLMYENGIGVNENKEKAMSLFQQAARGGHEPAMMRMSGQPVDSFQVPHNIQKAIEHRANQDNAFDTRPEAVMAPPKTHKVIKKIDYNHDKAHYADALHFNKELQKDHPKLIFKEEDHKHAHAQIALNKEINPHAQEEVIVNRHHENLSIEKLASNNHFIIAEKAYNNKKYLKAKNIWEIDFKKNLSDESAYRLGMMYHEGIKDSKGEVIIPQNFAKTYYYWTKGADKGGKKSKYALDDFRATLSDQELLKYEQSILLEK